MRKFEQVVFNFQIEKTQNQQIKYLELQWYLSVADNSLASAREFLMKTIEPWITLTFSCFPVLFDNRERR